MASSYLVGAPDDASCMRYEIYAIGEEGEGAGNEGEEEMLVDGGNGVVVAGDADAAPSLLLAAARSHVVAACSSAETHHLWYRDSLLSTLRLSTEEEAPWRKGKGKGKNVHAGASTSTSTTSSPSSPPSPPLPPCLWGELDFGDAVDDEWAAAWMLLKATYGSFKVPGGNNNNGASSLRLAARCWDDDGDFLLIEAADALPRWLSPLNSENRCWLAGGRVHVIPRRWMEGCCEKKAKGAAEREQEQQGEQRPSLVEALEVLSRGLRSSSPAPSDAGPRIHAALLKRLGDPQCPPRALRRPPHAARALLPPRLAALLSSEDADSSLVSAAVDSFYRRDPKGLRAASRARWFPPAGAAGAAGEGEESSRSPSSSSSSSPSLLVPFLVKTTRLQFAQLSLQQYEPPRGGWPILPRGHGDAAAVELGAKLAAGFEILMTANSDPPSSLTTEENENAAAQPSSSSSAAQPSSLPSDPLSLDALDPPGWKDYLKALEARGAFDGEVRGSKRHQELRRQAAAAFSSGNTSAPSAKDDDFSSSPASNSSSAASAAALRAASILKNLGEEIDVEALRKAGDAAVASQGESSVSWLRSAAAASSSPNGEGGGGGGASDSDDDEVLEAMAEAEARQAAEAGRRHQQRKKKEKEKKKEKGGEAMSADEGEEEGEGDEMNDEDFDHPASVVEKVKAFVEKMSSWEGAEAGSGSGTRAGAAAAAAVGKKDDDGDDEEAASLFAGDRAGAAGGISLDESSFWDELGAALGVPLGGLDGAGDLGDVLGAASAAGENGEEEEEEGSNDDDDDDDDDDEGSSFYSERGSDDDDDDDGDNNDEEERSLPRKLLEAEAARLRALEASGSGRARRGAPPPEEEEGGGSRFAFPASAAASAAAGAKKKKGEGNDDDDDDFAFATAYEAELGRQLRGTTLGQTWGSGGGGGEEKEEEEEEEGGAPSTSRAAKRAATSSSAVGGSSGIACLDANNNNNPLAPVNVDVNLLESLLASYAGEAGFPGPASTLAGMLGVSLPPPSSTISTTSRPSAASSSAALAPPTPSTSEKD